MFTSAETTNKEGATEQSNRHQHQEDVPDSTTASFSVRQQQAGLPPVAGDTATPAAELAELTTAEISLDLQNLIEEASFDFSAATAATTAAAGGAGHDVQQPQQQQQQPDYVNRPGSLGSTGQASPGSSNGGQESPTDFQYRPPPPAAALAYLPGSVHHGSFMNAMNNNNNVQVKQVIWSEEIY